MHWRAPDWGCGGPGPAVSAGPIIPMIAARRDRPVRHHSLTPTRDSQNLNGSFRSGPGTNRPARRRSGRAVSVIPVLVLGPFSPGLEPNGFVFRISVPLFSEPSKRESPLRLVTPLSLFARAAVHGFPDCVVPSRIRPPAGCLPARPAVAGRTPSGFAAGASRHPHDSGALVLRLSSPSLTVREGDL